MNEAEAAAYLGALPAKEGICVTQPFQSENCPNSHPIKILELHSSEGIQAIVSLYKGYLNDLILKINLIRDLSLNLYR